MKARREQLEGQTVDVAAERFGTATTNVLKQLRSFDDTTRDSRGDPWSNSSKWIHTVAAMECAGRWLGRSFFPIEPATTVTPPSYKEVMDCGVSFVEELAKLIPTEASGEYSRPAITAASVLSALTTLANGLPEEEIMSLTDFLAPALNALRGLTDWDRTAENVAAALGADELTTELQLRALQHAGAVHVQRAGRDVYYQPADEIPSGNLGGDPGGNALSRRNSLDTLTKREGKEEQDDDQR